MDWPFEPVLLCHTTDKVVKPNWCIWGYVCSQDEHLCVDMDKSSLFWVGSFPCFLAGSFGVTLDKTPNVLLVFER